MRILVGQISSYKSIVVCRYIKTNYPDVDILTYDYKPFTKYLRTKYSDIHFIIPEENKVSHLAELVSSQSVDIFIPVMSNEIELLLENRKMFGLSLAYLGDIESYKKLHYKNLFMETAESLNVKVPVRFNSINEAVIPFIIKPVNSSSASGVQYIFTENDRLKLNMNPSSDGFIAQEYIEGFGAGYSVFCRNGNILTGYGHKRLAEFPVTGGSSVYRTAFQNEGMVNIAKKIISSLNWSGFCMFEFKITKDREAVLIEANPRIWGSINQGLMNGVNYFEPLLGSASIYTTKQRKYNTYLSPLIYLAMIKYMFKGKLSLVKNFLIDMNKKADVSIFDDFKGYTNLIAKKIKIIFWK